MHAYTENKDHLRYRAVSVSNVEQRRQWRWLSPELQEAVKVVSTVLPFRTNDYVMDELIDWRRVPDDPIYQLTFPQKGMLSAEHYETMHELLRKGAPRSALDEHANRIRYELNPHPAGQMTHNVPVHRGRRLEGMQHKYRETVLFFPSQGQTCHAYCTFCFRWAQFVGMEELKFSNQEVAQLVEYLADHREVSDVLFTGGDPMIMSTRHLRSYLEALLDPRLEHITTIRIGTKAVAYWPQRFVTDPDADELMRLFEQVVDAGKHLALMGHYSHPVELSTPIARQALRRIRASGANIRMQSPCIRHVNDDSGVWASLWREGLRLGAIPYYMFVERDTGAREYFALPLARVWEIFRGAYSQVSGLARTVRGPSMSALPGKVHILGVSHVREEKVFVLQYIQARDPQRVRRPFFARFDPRAVWFNELKPLSDCDRPYFGRQDEPDCRSVQLMLDSGEAVA